MTDRAHIIIIISCCAVFGLYLGGLAAGVFTFQLAISDVSSFIFTAALVYFAMQQSKISESQFNLSLEMLKPSVVVRSEDYRDIFVENAGTRPVFNVKLHARKSQETNLRIILDKKIIGSRKYEKIETPDEWKEHNIVIDYILSYSTERTGKGSSESGFILLKKP